MTLSTGFFLPFLIPLPPFPPPAPPSRSGCFSCPPGVSSLTTVVLRIGLSAAIVMDLDRLPSRLARNLKRYLQHPSSSGSYYTPQYLHISPDLLRFPTTRAVEGADLRAALEASYKRGFLLTAGLPVRDHVRVACLLDFLAYTLFLRGLGRRGFFGCLKQQRCKLARIR
jgi:hypothetical protein